MTSQDAQYGFLGRTTGRIWDGYTAVIQRALFNPGERFTKAHLSAFARLTQRYDTGAYCTYDPGENTATITPTDEQTREDFEETSQQGLGRLAAAAVLVIPFVYFGFLDPVADGLQAIDPLFGAFATMALVFAFVGVLGGALEVFATIHVEVSD